MFSRYIGALFTALSLAIAQQSSVPSDLSTNFDPSSITLQILYSDASKTDLHGVGDGATISQKETSQTPSFSFGDASEVNFSLVTMILLVDTTTSNRQLHFLQTGFTSTQDATAITSTDKPLVPYAAPGTLGEPSETRKYSWLLFQQTSSLKTSGLKAGNFDVQKFISDNNLQPAIAGIEMVVPVQGQSNSNSGSGSDSSAAAAPSSSTIRATSKAQTSTTQNSQSTTQAQPTSTVPIITIASSSISSSTSTSSSIPSPSQTAAAATTTSTSTSTSTPVTTVSISTSTPPPVTMTTFVAASSTTSATSSSSTGAAPRFAAGQDTGFAMSWLVFGAMLVTHVLG